VLDSVCGAAEWRPSHRSVFRGAGIQLVYSLTIFATIFWQAFRPEIIFSWLRGNRYYYDVHSFVMRRCRFFCTSEEWKRGPLWFTSMATNCYQYEHGGGNHANFPLLTGIVTIFSLWSRVCNEVIHLPRWVYQRCEFQDTDFFRHYPINFFIIPITISRTTWPPRSKWLFLLCRLKVYSGWTTRPPDGLGGRCKFVNMRFVGLWHVWRG
jgi:hypothetical protein